MCVSKYISSCLDVSTLGLYEMLGTILVPKWGELRQDAMISIIAVADTGSVDTVGIDCFCAPWIRYCNWIGDINNIIAKYEQNSVQSEFRRGFCHIFYFHL